MMASRLLLLTLACVPLACSAPSATPPLPSPPATLADFRAAAARIVERSGVPGAGIALVRADGIEWAGGIGLADRERGLPVTADTHFRVGSISKTFVAVALVQQYEDGALDLETPVAEIVPEVAIDNPFTGTPVTVLHLLQHTAGFDDMHFNEIYNRDDPPDLPLADVLRRGGASRRVRWRPGTRMSYSNPGYAVAGAVLERVTGRPYEDVIRERILEPLGMTTSRFTLDDDDLPLLARGYETAAGPPVPFTPIYLRPAGNLHSSPAELARFVRMLLNWGEAEGQLVIDPEYLSNMERPRSSLAASAGLIYGYGSGIASRTLAGYPVLGHDGGIDGFVSTFGYSTARDVGWVVLVNAASAGPVVEELAALAVSYLKREVEPPPKPTLAVAPSAVAAHAGYYHPSGARQAVLEPLEWLMGGVRISPDADALIAVPAIGAAHRLVPVTDQVFRRDADVTPSRVFTTGEDGAVLLLGDGFYGVRTPRWRVEIVRLPILTAAAVLATAPIALVVWLVRARRAEPRPFRALKLALVTPAAGLAAMAMLILWVPTRDWGTANIWTRAAFLGSWALPLGAVTSLALLPAAWRDDAGRWFLGYATALAAAGTLIAAYAAWWGLVGLRPWAY